MENMEATLIGASRPKGQSEAMSLSIVIQMQSSEVASIATSIRSGNELVFEDDASIARRDDDPFALLDLSLVCQKVAGPSVRSIGMAYEFARSESKYVPRLAIEQDFFGYLIYASLNTSPIKRDVRLLRLLAGFDDSDRARVIDLYVSRSDLKEFGIKLRQMFDSLMEG